VAIGCGLNAGLNVVADLAMGAGGTAFSNANARIKVGNLDTAADPSQTDVLGTAVIDTLDPAYPSVSGQTLSFRATFAAGAITLPVKEVSVTNGATGLVRVVLDTTEQFTPAAGDIPRIQVDVVLA
jgi:hypothetical protein